MFVVLLGAFALFSTAHTLIVCRNDGQEQVTCPDDFYCCHQDMCCKVYFADDADEEPWNSWVEALCLRTLVVCVFMVLLLLIAKSVQYLRKHYRGKNIEEEDLPRYFRLDKTVIDMNNIAVLIGSPLCDVNGDSLSSFRNPGGMPI